MDNSLPTWISAYESRRAQQSIIADPGFMSTTTSPKKTYPGKHTIIVEKPDRKQKSRGKHIADYAADPSEQEVLFPPGTPFQIIDMQRDEDDTITFRLSHRRASGHRCLAPGRQASVSRVHPAPVRGGVCAGQVPQA